jgi:adenylate cyclase
MNDVPHDRQHESYVPHRRQPILKLLLAGYAVMILLPALVLTAFAIRQLAGTGSAGGASLLLTAASAVCLAGAIGFGAYLVILMRRRVVLPLARFRSTLEDISEGFIIDHEPEEALGRAEPGIAEAFRQVIQINKMLLKNADNLEQGFEEERQAKLAQVALTRAYQRFVPQDFISFLQRASITEVKLGDHVLADMTILVSDIRSFTSLSERLTPEENFQLINAYLLEMEPAVHEEHGFIDKYMGDAIMALFHRSPDHAMRASLAMLHRLRDFNTRRAAAGEVPLAIGIGLNTGSLMLGIIGGESRMEGTVISDAVNMASRVEDLNKRYGTSLLLTEHTYSRLADPSQYAIRPVDRVRVKGKSELVILYECFDADEPAAAARKLDALPTFLDGWKHYAAGRFAEALPLFVRCRGMDPADAVYGQLIERCEALDTAGAANAAQYTKAGEKHDSRTLA